MENPIQWPKCDNLSEKYASRALQRLNDLAAAAMLVQRWRRQRTLPVAKRRLYPIVIDSRTHCIWWIAKRVGGQGDCGESVIYNAYEKLDGTNLGIRCDGAVFGRRLMVDGTSYQKVELDGVIPTMEAVNAFKVALGNMIGVQGLPKLLLYGELMIHPGRYGYQDRGMDKSWYCFGLMLAPYEKCKDDCDNIDLSENLCARLGEHRFFASMAPDSGKIRVLQNDEFSALATSVGIKCAPKLDSGPLEDIVFGQREFMKTTKSEGMVLTSQKNLTKWKIGDEDDSKGHTKLVSLLSGPVKIRSLELAGVNVEFAKCLEDVAGNRIKARGRAIREKKKDNKGANFGKAIESACSKYETLEVYFERNERNKILELLVKEVLTDLTVSSANEKKSIEKAVKKYVGSEYGKWKGRA